MKSLLTVIAIVVPILVGLSFIIFKPSPPQTTPQPISPTVQPTNEPKTLEIKATFKIVTDRITRNFSNPKYHKRSADVFIQADDPSIIYVKKSGITWQNFFDTLPMKLTKECLTTGDGETFCNQKGGSLKFYLNNIEDQDLLDKEIKEKDQILVKFSSQ